MPVRILLASVIVLVLVACGDDEDASPTAPGAAPSVTSAATAPPSGSPTVAPGGSPEGVLPGPVRAAIAAAAEDEGMEEGAVELVRWWYEEWESSALGCPQPDMLYLPVITPGYAVQLEVEGRPLESHTNLDTVVVRCPTLAQP